MSSLKVIRTAIKTTLEAGISGIKCYDTVQDATNVLPAVVVIPFTADFEKAMGRGTDQWSIDLLVLTSTGDPTIGQNSLDDFVSGAGTKSIRQVIFQNKTLGLTDVDAHVSQLLEYGMRFTNAEVPHIGARLRLEIYTSGTG